LAANFLSGDCFLTPHKTKKCFNFGNLQLARGLLQILFTLAACVIGGRYYLYISRHSGEFPVPKDFKSLLPPKLIRLLEHKMETGEMAPEECKAVLKEYMLREFDRQQAGQSPNSGKALAMKFQNLAQSWLKKILERSPAEPTISMEELAGTVRVRRI
jgi:hypothetical protein